MDAAYARGKTILAVTTAATLVLGLVAVVFIAAQVGEGVAMPAWFALAALGVAGVVQLLVLLVASAMEISLKAMWIAAAVLLAGGLPVSGVWVASFDIPVSTIHWHILAFLPGLLALLFCWLAGSGVRRWLLLGVGVPLVSLALGLAAVAHLFVIFVLDMPGT